MTPGVGEHLRDHVRVTLAGEPRDEIPAAPERTDTAGPDDHPAEEERQRELRTGHRRRDGRCNRDGREGEVAPLLATQRLEALRTVVDRSCVHPARLLVGRTLYENKRFRNGSLFLLGSETRWRAQSGPEPGADGRDELPRARRSSTQRSSSWLSAASRTRRWRRSLREPGSGGTRSTGAGPRRRS